MQMLSWSAWSAAPAQRPPQLVAPAGIVPETVLDLLAAENFWSLASDILSNKSVCLQIALVLVLVCLVLGLMHICYLQAELLLGRRRKYALADRAGVDGASRAAHRGGSDMDVQAGLRYNKQWAELVEARVDWRIKKMESVMHRAGRLLTNLDGRVRRLEARPPAGQHAAKGEGRDGHEDRDDQSLADVVDSGSGCPFRYSMMERPDSPYRRTPLENVHCLAHAAHAAHGVNDSGSDSTTASKSSSCEPCEHHHHYHHSDLRRKGLPGPPSRALIRGRSKPWRRRSTGDEARIDGLLPRTTPDLADDPVSYGQCKAQLAEELFSADKNLKLKYMSDKLESKELPLLDVQGERPASSPPLHHHHHQTVDESKMTIPGSEAGADDAADAVLAPSPSSPRDSPTTELLSRRCHQQLPTRPQYLDEEGSSTDEKNFDAGWEARNKKRVQSYFQHRQRLSSEGDSGSIKSPRPARQWCSDWNLETRKSPECLGGPDGPDGPAGLRPVTVPDCSASLCNDSGFISTESSSKGYA